MKNYTFWYKTKVQADDIEQAVSLSKKSKPRLDGIETKDEEIVEGMSVIGFQDN